MSGSTVVKPSPFHKPAEAFKFRPKLSATKKFAPRRRRPPTAAKAAPLPEDDDDGEIEFGRPDPGAIQIEEVELGSAAGLIQMDDDEEDAEDSYVPPPLQQHIQG